MFYGYRCRYQPLRLPRSLASSTWSSSCSSSGTVWTRTCRVESTRVLVHVVLYSALSSSSCLAPSPSAAWRCAVPSSSRGPRRHAHVHVHSSSRESSSGTEQRYAHTKINIFNIYALTIIRYPDTIKFLFEIYIIVSSVLSS